MQMQRFEHQHAVLSLSKAQLEEAINAAINFALQDPDNIDVPIPNNDVRTSGGRAWKQSFRYWTKSGKPIKFPDAWDSPRNEQQAQQDELLKKMAGEG